MRQPEEFELLERNSCDSTQSSSLLSSAQADESEHQNKLSRYLRPRTRRRLLRFWVGRPVKLTRQIFTRSRDGRPSRQRLYWSLFAIPWVTISLLVFIAFAFFPSYTNEPDHYRILERRCQESQIPGLGNINNEKVFIAATLYDRNGQLLSGEWGDAVVQLVHLLGPSNVHVSVYENDPDELAKAALSSLASRLPCRCPSTKALRNVTLTKCLL